MKAKITVWLFLLLVWSNSGIEQAWGQKVINRFPYEMEQEGWSLGEGILWNGFDPSDPGCSFEGNYFDSSSFALSPTFDLSSLKEPEITFVGKGFEMRDNNGNLLYSQKEEKSVTLLLNKKITQLTIHAIENYPLKIKNIVIGEKNIPKVVINQFPYEMKQEGWSLGESFEWTNFTMFDPGCGFIGEYSPTADSFTLSPTLDLSGLKEPKITFIGKGFIMKDDNGNTLHSEKEEKSVTLPLDKKITRLKFYPLESYSLMVKNIVISEKNIPKVVIDKFPYEMKQEGWSLGKTFKWMNFTMFDPGCGFIGEYFPTGDSFTLSPTLDLSGLKEPEITFIGKGFIMKDGNDNILHSESGKEEKTVTLQLDKKITQLKFYQSETYSLMVKNIVISEKGESEIPFTYSWKEENGKYTLSGTGSVPSGKTVTYQLPSFYNYQYSGHNQSICFTVKNVSYTDEISLLIGNKGYKQRLTDGKQKIVVPYNLEGLIEVHLEAAHIEGTTSNVIISDYVSPVSYYYPVESASNIYDIDGDGKMEFLATVATSGSYENAWNKYHFSAYEFPGLTLIPNKNIPAGNDCSTARLCNLNNDAIPDIRYLKGGKIAIGETSSWNLLSNIAAPYPCDYNNDGKPDLMENTRFIFRQGEEGAFYRTEIVPVTSEEDTLVYNRWESNIHSSSMGLGNLGGDVGVPIGDSPVTHIASFASAREYYSMDFNKDGYEDLINEQTGAILLNRGNNRFLYAPQEGKLYPRDLNGDYITDYVVYNEDTKKVSTIIFKKDGGIDKQILMSNLTMDEDIYFYDFDRDGDVDILLPFSNSADIGEYSYLVLCINDGKGHFNINEDNTYRRKWHFIDCADYDNNGYYDVLAIEKVPGEGALKNIYCLNGTKKLSFTETSTPILQEDKVPIEDYNMKNVRTISGDFDGDGIYDVLLHQMDYNYSAGTSLFFHFNDGITSVNRAPEKPKVPTIVSDPAVGMLKINWSLGKDDKTPACDLTYALRIGSESGKGDIFYANADANGRRLNIQPGNMGYNLDKILNVSGWKKGNYYVAVQTVDPMGKGSVWSDEVVYKHETVNASIFLSNKSMTTGDTLIVAYDGITNPQNTYTWNLDGGEIIEANNEKTRLQVVFNTQGQKNISLRVTDAEGNVSTPATDDVYVSPVRFDDKSSAYMNDPYAAPYIMSVSDTDGDGKFEFITTDGIYKQNSAGKYEKAPGIFNTNLKIRDIIRPFDYNKDGLVDFIGNFNEIVSGEYAANLLLNKGKNSFGVQKENISKLYFDNKAADFNNDGYIDYVSKDEYVSNNLILNINSGDNSTFNKVTIRRSYSLADDIQVFDFNNDNLPDLLIRVCDADDVETNGSSTTYYYHREILLNKGNSEFEQIKIPVEYRDKIQYVIDLNNDGINDLFCYRANSGDTDYNHSYIYLSQNGELSYPSEPMELPNIAGYPNHPTSVFFTDVDNNGYLDIVGTNLDKILYMYPDGQSELYTYTTTREANEGSWGLNWRFRGIYYPIDLNGDGRPDYVGQCNGLNVTGNTRIINTAPEIPQNIRATQDNEGFVTVEWDPAKDAETPFVQMRYNLSVKKQGATGEGAFIISPLNGLSNTAKSIPMNYEYLRGTQYRIPVSAMPVGKYEIQIQSIDGWNTSSNFSQPFILEVTPKPLLNLPKEICQNKSVTVRYNGTITNEIQMDWGDATVLHNNGDNSYEVMWSTAGMKTLKVTSEGVTTPVSFLVKAAIDASFSLSAVTLANAETLFEISDDIFSADRTFKFEVAAAGKADTFDDPSRFGIRFDRKKNTKEVKAVFSKAGSYLVRLTVQDGGCGDVMETKSVTVKEAFAKPQISLISVDKETGKNQLNWQFKNLPDYVTKVMVYKENNHYNQFDLIGEATPSQNRFVDVTSNPSVTTSRYRIRLNTSFGVMTDPGNTHQSVHLTINKGMGSGWNLMWSKYEGATIDNYRILRGTSADNMHEITSVSGNVSSYSDLSAPAGLLYYAIEYSAYYEDEWEPMRAGRKATSRSAVLVKAESNVVNVANAQNVTFVEELYIRHLEEEATLNDDQQTLHLYADVYPVTAAYKNVNWTITKGGDLAYITTKGLLVANSTKSGEVTVRATAIDGSETYAELTVSMFGVTGIVSPESTSELIVYPSPVSDRLFIKGIPLHEGKAQLAIIGLNGQCMYMKEVRTEEAEVSCSAYPAGIYILRIVTDDKVMTQRFMKK